MIVNEKMKNRIVGFRIRYRVDSDHLPLIVELKKEKTEEERRKRKEKEKKKKRENRKNRGS